MNEENYYIVIEHIKEPLTGDKYIVNLRDESVLEVFESMILGDGEKVIRNGISKLEVEELKKQGIEEV